MRETPDGFQGGLQIAWQMITHLRYADDIILLATSEAEQPQIQPTHQRRQDQGIIASYGILVQNEQLEQIDTFPYLGSLTTEDGEYTTEFRTRLNRGQAIGAPPQKIWKSHSISISTKIRLMKALVWTVATYGCKSWTLRKNEKTYLDAFVMKGLRKILRVSWTAKKTNEWVLNKAGVKRLSLIHI